MKRGRGCMVSVTEDITSSRRDTALQGPEREEPSQSWTPARDVTHQANAGRWQLYLASWSPTMYRAGTSQSHTPTGHLPMLWHVTTAANWAPCALPGGRGRGSGRRRTRSWWRSMQVRPLQDSAQGKAAAQRRRRADPAHWAGGGAVHDRRAHRVRRVHATGWLPLSRCWRWRRCWSMRRRRWAL